MRFSQKKLSIERSPFLRQCAIESVRAYAFMIAPTYVYMQKNKKFIAVKAPLDFFSQEELEKLKSYEFFYFTPFIDTALIFREAARKIKALLMFQDEEYQLQKLSMAQIAHLPPAPYEISDAVLRLLAPLWGRYFKIEPFFITVFANELCDLISKDKLTLAREKNILALESALLKSSWCTFLALHLGYCDLSFLNRLRISVFERELNQNTLDNFGDEQSLLYSFVHNTLPSQETESFSLEFFQKNAGILSAKITQRLGRIRDSFLSTDTNIPSILGPEGFIND
ncbi:MAG: hypothetical protein HY843_07625 [Bdellovibrio sp.]|nr:hypothetical protein [Bdellovibrio sp.]